MISKSQQQSIYVHKAKATQQQLTPLKGEPLIFELRFSSGAGNSSSELKPVRHTTSVIYVRH